MKSKRLYKVVRLLMIVSLVVQALLPALAIAETIDKEEKNGRTTLNKAQWEDEKDLQTVIVEGKVEKGTAEDNQPETIVLKGADFENVTTEEKISGLTDGSYKLEDNKVLLNLTEQSEGNFALKLHVVKDSLVNGKEIEVTLGDQVLTLPIKLEETDKEKPTDDEKTSDKEAETKPEKETKPEQESSTSKKQVGNIADKDRGLPFGTTQTLANGVPWNFVKDSKVSDPDTDADMGFSDVPGNHDGRVWTDKTVRHDLGSLEDDQFEVTLSALAQGAPTRAGYQIPADTVFTIDVSGSMTRVDEGAGRSRIALLVDALNEAISILQEANPLNRVAVVAYGGRTGGYARVENILTLGRYNTSNNGVFFTMTGNSQVNVVATPATNLGGQVKVNNFIAQGSTPTQWGIREASRILESVNDRQVEVPMTDEDGNAQPDVTVTRRPNLILMTDGEPTMGRRDFTFDDLDIPVDPNGGLLGEPGEFYGNGSNGEQGLAVMTALTAAYRGKTVLNHYFPDGNVAGTPEIDQPAADVGFFSISLGQQTEAAQKLISATLNPISENTREVGPNIWQATGMPSYSGAPTAATPTMETLFNNFVTNGSTGNFSALFRKAWNNYQWRNTVNISENETAELSSEEIAYADEFFKADDLQTLREAFLSITNSIQETGNSSIFDGNGDGSDLGSGMLDFSDVLGKYMTFDGLTNIEFPAPDGETFTYDIANVDAHKADFVKTLTAQIRQVDGVTPIDATTAEAILDNRPDGVITYYSDDHGRFVGLTNLGDAATKVQLYPVWGGIQNQVDPAVNNVSGLLFSVHTALRDITFTSDYGSIEHVSGYRKLEAKDQFVHWSIPANLIPERTVQQTEDGTLSITGNTSPIRARFNVGLDEARLEEDFRAGVNVPTNFFSNYWDNEANSSFATFEPANENPFYHLDGARIVPKAQNPTGTKPYVSKQIVEADQTGNADERIVTNLLGNNGTFALEYYGQIRLEKEFLFLDENGNRVNPDGAIPDGVKLQPLTFTITGPRGFEQTVTFDPDKFELVNGKWQFDLPADLPAGVYTVKEAGGDVEESVPGYTHMPGEFDQTVTVTPGGTGTASFVNVYVSPALGSPSLRIMKFFHGLPEGVYPEDFEILIQGPHAVEGVPVNPQPELSDVWTLNPDTNRYEARVSLEEAIAGTSFIGVAKGTYTITENNADAMQNTGYILSNSAWAYRQLGEGNPENFGSGQGLEPVDVTIGEIDDVSFRFDNFYQKLGSLDLTKNFENIPLDRIPENFEIVVTNDDTGDEVGRLTKTDILNGQKTIHADELPPGSYTITEANFKIDGWDHIGTANIDGAMQFGTGDPIKYHFDIPGLIGNSDVVVNMYNIYSTTPITPPIPPVYPLQMTKVDQYDNRVAGAEFDLEVFDTSLNGGAGDWRILVKGLQSNSDGLVRYEVTEPGRYRFHETQAPGGYQLPENPYSEEREVVDGNTETLYFDDMVNILTARIQLHKTDVEGEGLAGAVFKVEYRATETDNWSLYMDNMTTGAGGYLGLNVENDGYYRFIETQAPDGFVLDSTPREVHVNAGDTGDTIFNVDGVVNRPYASIQLRKTDMEGQNLAGAVFKVEFSENENGPWETVAENLTSGDDGLVKLEDIEKDGFYRFIETEAPDGFVLDSEPRQVHVTAGVGGQVLFSAGDMANRPIASIQLRKTDAEGQNLAGAVFKVEFSTDGNDPWETVAEDLTSGDNGLVKLDVEKDGYYRFVETQAPAGFILDSTPRQVKEKVTIGDTGEALFEAENMVNIRNARIQLRKTDEAGQNLAGAVFRLEYSENENGPWETYREDLESKADGLVSTEVDKAGFYRFIETEAPDGFILDSEPRQVPQEVTMGGEEQALFDAGTMENKPVDPETPMPPTPPTRHYAIQLLKVNEQDNPLQGAVFKVETEDGEIVAQNVKSNADGLVTVTVPGPGKYRFVEIQAPSGYKLDKTPQYVTIAEEDGLGVFAAGKLVNKPKPRLPIVGDNLGLWLLTSGLIFLLGAGFVLYKKKKSKI